MSDRQVSMQMHFIHQFIISAFGFLGAATLLIPSSADAQSPPDPVPQAAAADIGLASVRDPVAVAARYEREAKQFLEKYCYSCHGDGASEGNQAFDKLSAEGKLLNDPNLWEKILNNVRAGIMPPAGKVRPSDGEIRQVRAWVHKNVFGIDPANPDPGRVVLRRLNRVEYQNTIRDLLGHDYDVVLQFPPDDTGYGFDTIGEVLTVSAMLTEKYLNAAEAIVDAAIPTVTWQPAERVYKGDEFIDAITLTLPNPNEDGRSGVGGENFVNNRGWPRSGKEIHFEEEADLRATFNAPLDGHYEIDIAIRIDGQFEYNPLRSQVEFLVDGQKQMEQTYVYHDGENYHYRTENDWKTGEHQLRFKVTPLPPAPGSPTGRPEVFVRFIVQSVQVRGPMAREHWVNPPSFVRFFTRLNPPDGATERSVYAREVLGKFAMKAFRRPVDEPTLDALALVAQAEYLKPGSTFERGIGRAFVAILTSPRFLYRLEDSLPLAKGEIHPLIDEYALASRLSYLFWSTMPDDELFKLAADGKLRDNLDAQIDRMIADQRSDAFVKNFVGQWLRTRDVAHVRIDAGAVTSRDVPLEEIGAESPAASEVTTESQATQNNPQTPASPSPSQPPPVQNRQVPPDQLAGRAGVGRGRGLGRGPGRGPAFAQGRGRGRGGRGGVQFNETLRSAMQQETDLQFAYIMRNDRSLLELIDSDYSFLNQQLAQLYQIPGVQGNEMRLVKLPEDSPRGGVLTQGTLLTITSNPDRTSPVKRGLFILENILGTPPPPPPGDVTLLEEAAEKFLGKKPTLREVLEFHRDAALCAACHARMDPLGLALENFNALGMWRQTDGREKIDPAGKLISGEQFSDIRELKTILKQKKQRDFYGCVAEKLMTYALGRGMEFTDAHTIEQIVDALDESGGKFSVLIDQVIKSPQFQQLRVVGEEAMVSN